MGTMPALFQTSVTEMAQRLFRDCADMFAQSDDKIVAAERVESSLAEFGIFDLFEDNQLVFEFDDLLSLVESYGSAAMQKNIIDYIIVPQFIEAADRRSRSGRDFSSDFRRCPVFLNIDNLFLNNSVKMRHQGMRAFYSERMKQGHEAVCFFREGDWLFRKFLKDDALASAARSIGFLGEVEYSIPQSGNWRDDAEAVLEGADFRSILELRRFLHAIAVISALNENLEDISNYLQTRKQFNRPLAENQVIKHRIADIFCDLEVFRGALYTYFMQYRRSFEANMLSAHAEDLERMLNQIFNKSLQCCRMTVQLYGGIGVTEENPGTRLVKFIHVGYARACTEKFQ